MDENLVTDIRQSAEAYFASGLYCAESVVLALSRAQGLDSDVLPRMATAFCSGMARTCGTCGALTGAVMGVSLALGRSRAEDSVQPAYEGTRKLVQEFEQEFGSGNCQELLGCDLGTPEGQSKFRDEKLHERCAKYTSRATEIAARIILAGSMTPMESVTQATEIRNLLATCNLQNADIVPSESLIFFGCRANAELVGVVGLELFDSVALLRSLAVAPSFRKQQLGKSLVAFAEAHAMSLGIRTLFLLTTTAENYFSRLGYVPTSRENAPLAIRNTAQFSGLCPASSCLMSKQFGSSQ